MTTHKQGPAATFASVKVGQILLVSKPDRHIGMPIDAETRA
jgi:hypothetical protein